MAPSHLETTTHIKNVGGKRAAAVACEGERTAGLVRVYLRAEKVVEKMINLSRRGCACVVVEVRDGYGRGSTRTRKFQVTPDMSLIILASREQKLVGSTRKIKHSIWRYWACLDR